ncbi:MAG: lipid-A-disaccharide synthase [Betaproteobacteria bacterium]
MSPPGRPKGEFLSAQREGEPAVPPGRPKGEFLSAQREGGPTTPPGRPDNELPSAPGSGAARNVPHIALVAGEASGDLLAALVLPELRARLPQAQCAGIAGDRMIAAGCVPWHHVGELSVRGYAEVLRHLPRLLALRRRLIRRLLDWPASVYVGVDAPDFNLGVAARLRAAGVPTVQFVSPAVWAWRPQRIERIRAAIDHMLLVFPFEQAIFDRAGIRATYVGHPLARTIPLEPDRAAARIRLGLPATAPVVALLPGSRRAEIDSLAPAFFGAVGRLQAADAQLRCVVPVAMPALRPLVERIQRSSGIDAARTMLLDGRSHDALEACDATILAGGTATLEAMLFKRPMVAAYRVPWLTERITLRQAVIPYFSLPNVLLGRFAVAEFLQESVEPLGLARALAHCLAGGLQIQALLQEFAVQHERLQRDTPALTAEAILATLGRGNDPSARRQT